MSREINTLADAISALRECGFDSVADDLAEGVNSEVVLSRLRHLPEIGDDAEIIVSAIGSPPTIDELISVHGVRVTVGRSAGSDGAVLVMVDTDFEPDASDGGPGLRVLVNDGDGFVGVPHEPKED